MAKRKCLNLKTKLASALARLLPREERDLCRHNKVSVKFILAKFEWDHIILVAHDGPDDWWNIDPKLKAEHRAKSAKDIGIIAKVKRLKAAADLHAARRIASPIVADELAKLETNRKWPKRTQRIPNRPWPRVQRSFPKRHKAKRSR
jgi:hypothetical protein